MNTAKHLKALNSQHLPKRRFLYSLVPTILLASLLGTYLDLYFVGKGLYEFPKRPLAAIFSINLVFTLFGLPLFSMLFLIMMRKLNRWSRLVFVLLISLTVPVVEQLSEHLGFFRHSDKWSHSYSFIGYFLFLFIIWNVFKWLGEE